MLRYREAIITWYYINISIYSPYPPTTEPLLGFSSASKLLLRFAREEPDPRRDCRATILEVVITRSRLAVEGTFVNGWKGELGVDSCLIMLPIGVGADEIAMGLGGGGDEEDVDKGFSCFHDWVVSLLAIKLKGIVF